jgi:hypothetical protein
MATAVILYDANQLAMSVQDGVAIPANTNGILLLGSDGTNARNVKVSATGVISVDGSAATQPVSGTVTANIGTTNGLALDATLTGGTQKAITRGGAKGATVAADLTGTAEGADHQALDVQIYHGGTAKDPTAIRALTSADVVTATGSKTSNGGAPDANNLGVLPSVATAAAPAFTEGNQTALSTLLNGGLRTDNSSWLGSTTPTVGQKVSASSSPVVLSSDQPAIQINANSRTYVGRYGASIARLAGSAAAQNISTIENPAASGKTLYIRKIKISSSCTAAAIVNFQCRLHRTTATPTGGTTQTAQKRATADATPVGIVRSGPTATAAAGTIWAAAGPSFQNNPTVYASEIAAWDSEGREEDDISLVAGEGLLLDAEANDVDFNFTVSYVWGEV